MLAIFSGDFAEELGLDHQEVLNLIEKYKEVFEEIGNLKPEYDMDADPDRDEFTYNHEKLLGYELEMNHQTLLIMLAPNTEKAIKQKIDLVKGRLAWD